MPGGRPSKYPKRKADREALIESVLECAREGMSLAEISAKVDVPRTTLLRWADLHDEFRTTLTRAKELEQAWWEGKARDGLLKGKDFNAALWAKSASARFKEKYTERQERHVSGEVRFVKIDTGLERAPDDPIDVSEPSAVTIESSD